MFDVVAVIARGFPFCHACARRLPLGFLVEARALVRGEDALPAGLRCASCRAVVVTDDMDDGRELPWSLWREIAPLA